MCQTPMNPLFCMLRCTMHTFQLYPVKLLTKLRCFKCLLNIRNHLILLLLQIYSKNVSCFSRHLLVCMMFLRYSMLKYFLVQFDLHYKMECVIVILILGTVTFTFTLVTLINQLSHVLLTLG